MLSNLSRILIAKASLEAAKTASVKTADTLLTRAYKNRHPKKTRKTVAVAGLPATVLGAALMYVFDPQKGSERRASIKNLLSGARSTEVKQKVQERSKHVIDLASKKAKRGEAQDQNETTVVNGS